MGHFQNIELLYKQNYLPNHIHNLQYSSLLNFYSLDEDKMEEVPTDSKLEKTLVYHKNGLKFIAKTTYIR